MRTLVLLCLVASAFCLFDIEKLKAQHNGISVGNKGNISHIDTFIEGVYGRIQAAMNHSRIPMLCGQFAEMFTPTGTFVADTGPVSGNKSLAGLCAGFVKSLGPNFRVTVGDIYHNLALKAAFIPHDFDIVGRNYNVTGQYHNNDIMELHGNGSNLRIQRYINFDPTQKPPQPAARTLFNFLHALNTQRCNDTAALFAPGAKVFEANGTAMSAQRWSKYACPQHWEHIPFLVLAVDEYWYNLYGNMGNTDAITAEVAINVQLFPGQPFLTFGLGVKIDFDMDYKIQRLSSFLPSNLL
eukprot:NODE_1178_length_967_cov_71.880952_g1133_i0.p1 GENE.NODE_1178_length_967_cov_71.880952_g1133_i0~~NODE_1178_length_967_cov_71.880952_g1133_i0.p1  ORF type:complete len:297 (+),score=36.80 NODE_1178_length_967_cov_71.880952_g1133_i0:66-956(+)